MKRGALALVLTFAGVTVLLHYKTPPIAAQRQAIATALPTPAHHALPPPARRPVPTAPPPRTNPPVLARTTVPVVAKRAATPAPIRTATPAPTRSYMGNVTATRYGTVQVEIFVQGSRIVNIDNVQMPNDTERSQEISDYAGPQLRQEALNAQSSNIDTISGATYTSDGYRQSLQSAIDDAAHLQ